MHIADPASDKGIEGHLFQTTKETDFTNLVIIYVEVAESCGGQTLVPPRPIPSGMGAFALFLDPSGNCIGLYQPKV